jgi:TRAP-type C4-dicarboxylate transport system substrate-binding protein
MESATDGRVKIEPYWSNTLSKSTNNWESVKSGITDIADCMMLFWPGLAPLSDVLSLPFIGVENAQMGSKIMWQLYEKYPTIQAEYKDVHPMIFGACTNVIITKEQVKTVEDIKGMKIRVMGGPPTSYLKAIGASPTLMSMNDVYMNIQKGVLDGVIGPWTSIESMKFGEVAEYVAEVPIYATMSTKAMNKDKWNSLPSDVQQALSSVNGLERSLTWSKAQFDDRIDLVKEKNLVTVYNPTPEEIAQWQVAAKPVWDEWLADMSEDGHSEAQEILNSAIEFIEAYK